ATTNIRAAFVVSEFAMAVVLLTGAGLLIRTLIAIHSVDPGFQTRNTVTGHLRFHNALQRTQRANLYGEAIRRIGELPGVRAAGGVSTMFFTDERGNFGLRAVEGRPPEERARWSPLSWSSIG